MMSRVGDATPPGDCPPWQGASDYSPLYFSQMAASPVRGGRLTPDVCAAPPDPPFGVGSTTSQTATLTWRGPKMARGL